MISAPIILPSISVSKAPFVKTLKPTPPLPEIRFPGGAPGVVERPPMTLLEPALMLIPEFGLGKATVPVRSVPIKLPCTLFSKPLPREIPRLLAAIMLRAASVSPPMELAMPSFSTPTPVFPRERVPVTSVPMKFPCTPLSVPPTIETPTPIFPEIRLRASGVVPPIVLFEKVPQKPRMTPPFPEAPFGNTAVPAALVPMKFPSIVLKSVQTSMPSC